MAINSFKGINSILDVVDTIQSVESEVVYPRGVLVIDSSRNIKLGDGTTAGGLAVAGSSGFGNSSVDSHLNTSTATSGQVLSWTGTDYDWVAQSGGGGGGISSTDDVPEGSSNLYYTDARADTRATLRITAASIGNLNDVDTTGASNGQALVWSSSNSRWEPGTVSGGGGSLNNIVEDTTPQLGGTLETNGNLIQFGDSASATDDRLQFGANQDLHIYHDSNFNNNVIDGISGHLIVRNEPSNTTNNVYVQADNEVLITTISATETMAKFSKDGGVELYYDDHKKVETVSQGISVVNETIIEGATPYLTIKRTDNANVPMIRFQGSAGANGATIGMDGTGGTVNDLIISAYGNAERIRTGVTGTQITGDLTITGRTDIKGSVFGDDSTVIVDSVNNAVTAKLISVNGPEPTSGSDAGEVGEIRFSDNYIYIKTAGFGWKRANLSGIA